MAVGAIHARLSEDDAPQRPMKRRRFIDSSEEESQGLSSSSYNEMEELVEENKYKFHPCTFPGCGKTFKKPSKLKLHEQSHTGERPFPCTFDGCTKSYRRAAHLAVHMLTHAATEEERKPFKCVVDGCMMAFATRHHLGRHHKIHETPKPYKCHHEGCEESYAKQSQLRRHQCTHTGTDLHLCAVQGCGKSFPTPSKLKAHTFVHSNDLRYACGVLGCDGRFSKWTLLQIHMRESHPVNCPVCRKPFTRKDTMKEHLQTHDEDREIFPCPWLGCEKTFAYQKNLNVHMRSAHQGIREHACDFPKCGSVFAHKHLLVRHKRLHEEDGMRVRKKRKDANVEPNFIELMTGMHYSSKDSGRIKRCPVKDCQYAFRRQYDVNRHVKSKHPEHQAVTEDQQELIHTDAMQIDNTLIP